jgi:TRAP-type C4-dicarboxylate transport system permease small subunit
LRHFSRLGDQISRYCDGLAAVAVALLIVIMLAQVVSRYVFSSSLEWADELALLAMIWAVLIGAVGVTRRSEHIHVSVFYNKLPRPLRITAIILARLLTIAAFLALAWYAYHVLANGFHRRSTVTGLSVWWGKLPFFIGGAAITAMALLVLAENLATVLRRDRLDTSNDSHTEI